MSYRQTWPVLCRVEAWSLAFHKISYLQCHTRQGDNASIFAAIFLAFLGFGVDQRFDAAVLLHSPDSMLINSIDGVERSISRNCPPVDD